MAPDDPPRPRRSDPTRARILEAARQRFAEHGYERTTIRAVAADADIDPSMVMRYYGSKDGLFAATATLDLELPDLSAIPRSRWGQRLATHFFDRWESRQGEETLALLLRAGATNPQAAERLRTVAAAQLVRALAQVGADKPERRAGLIAIQVLGLAFCRYVVRVPAIASAPPEQLVSDLAPTIQRYLTGTLT